MKVGGIELPIEDIFQFYGIRGLEELGLSDEEILKKIPSGYRGGMADLISRLKDAGWDLDRIHKAQEKNNFSWPHQETSEIYKKAGATSFENQIDELEGLVEDVEELKGYLGKLEGKITTTPETLSDTKTAVDNAYRQVHIILGQNYLQLARIAKDIGMMDMVKELTYNARVMFTFNSPPKELIKELYSLESSLKI